MKSPSDMTIYAPGLMRVVEQNCVSGNSPLSKRGVDNNVNQISKFVDQMRIDSEENRKLVESEEQRSMAQAKEISDKMIIDAERFRANIENPTGKVFNGNGDAGNEMIELQLHD